MFLSSSQLTNSFCSYRIKGDHSQDDDDDGDGPVQRKLALRVKGRCLLDLLGHSDIRHFDSGLTVKGRQARSNHGV